MFGKGKGVDVPHPCLIFYMLASFVFPLLQMFRYEFMADDFIFDYCQISFVFLVNIDELCLFN